MTRFALILFTFIFSACAGQSDPPLPVIHAGDPTWALTPDHLDSGSLPR